MYTELHAGDGVLCAGFDGTAADPTHTTQRYYISCTIQPVRVLLFRPAELLARAEMHLIPILWQIVIRVEMWCRPSDESDQ